MTTIKSRLALAASSLAMLLVTPACAQQGTPTPVQSTQVAAADVEMDTAPAAQTVEAVGPGLWKVADEDTTIYLFGTVHLLPDDVNWNSGIINDALASSGTLVTEIDMTEEAMAAMGPLVSRTALLSDGQTLRGLLDPAQLASYEAAMTKLEVPVAAFDPFEPWFAALQMTNVAYTKNGMNPELGVEQVLESLVGPDVERDALETVEFQLSVFDELPVEKQIAFLTETSDQIDEIGPMLDAMIANWATGDADGLGELMNEALASDPVLAERLLYARNANWAVWIDDRLDTPGTVFMAVGAGHLAGINSVQDLLAARGIGTTRVQ